MNLIESSNKKISDRLAALESGSVKRKRPLKVTASGSGDTSSKKKRLASTKANVKMALLTADDNDDDEEEEIIEETDSEHGTYCNALKNTGSLGSKICTNNIIK